MTDLPISDAFIKLIEEKYAYRDIAVDLEAIFELSTDLLLIVEKDHVTKASRSWQATLQLAPEQIIGKPLIELFHPTDRPLASTEINRVRGTNNAASFYGRVLDKDNRGTWFGWRVCSLRDHLYVIGRLMHDPPGTPTMMWMCDQTGMCSFHNKAWLDFTGMTEQVCEDWLKCVHPDDRAYVRERYRTASSTESMMEVSYRLRHKSGVYRSVYDMAVPRYSESGQFAGYVGSCVDISGLH